MTGFAWRLSAFVALACAAGAQSPFPLVLAGDPVSGGGKVTGLEYVHVDRWGSWTVQAATDRPASLSVVLRQGSAWKKVGDPVSVPAGAQIAAFDSFTTELFGGVAWNARLVDTPGGSSDDEALYFEDSLWIQKGPIASWPTTNLPAGSRWVSFEDLKCSVAGGGVLLRGRLDDPTVPGSDETFVAAGSLCGSIGVLCAMDRIAGKGLPAPGTGATVEAVRLSPGSAAIAPSSEHLLWSCGLRGPTDADGCVFHYSWQTQHRLLAREGSPSPVPGRVWGPLDDPGLDVNSQGTWTMRAELDASDPATDALIVKGGAVLVREGDSLPAIAPFVLDDFGDGRALLDEAGRVFWYGHWSDPGGSAEALFVDHRILVRTGTTTIGGLPLVAIGSKPDDLAISPDGDYIVFKGTLAGGIEGAFGINTGLVVSYCSAKLSSKGCWPQITWIGGPPSASAGSGFLVRGTKILSQVPGFLVYGTAGPQIAPYAGGLLCVRPPVRRLPRKLSGGSSPPASACDGQLGFDFNTWAASGVDPALTPGRTVFAQIWYRDPGFTAPDDVGLTAALEFTLGP